jgi:hypothetical protein
MGGTVAEMPYLACIAAEVHVSAGLLASVPPTLPSKGIFETTPIKTGEIKGCADYWDQLAHC